jgi:hypothetical protein
MPDPRAFDHFVLPVATLAAARAELASLGFTVAPDARHPFGTENCCVFFEDASFLEPLAIGDAAAYADALKNRNQFVANDQHLRGKTGISQLVIRSADAMADDRAWRQGGLSGGDVLDFGRVFTRPDGSKGEVAFRLAFASAGEAANAGFFSCEVVKSVPGGRGALLIHDNGAKGVRALVATAADPRSEAGFLAEFLQSEAETDDEGFLRIRAAGGAELHIMPPEAFAARFGHAAQGGGALTLQALVISVADLGVAAACLSAQGVGFSTVDNRLIVTPEKDEPSHASMGAVLVFEALP